MDLLLLNNPPDFSGGFALYENHTFLSASAALKESNSKSAVIGDMYLLQT